MRLFNPFTAAACKISGLNSAQMHSSKQYIRWSYSKSTFSIPCIWIQVFTCSFERGWGGGGGSLNHFKFGTVTVFPPDDGAASTAVKGLTVGVMCVPGCLPGELRARTRYSCL